MARLGLLQVGGVGLFRVITGPAAHRKVQNNPEHVVLMQINSVKKNYMSFLPFISALY